MSYPSMSPTNGLGPASRGPTPAPSSTGPWPYPTVTTPCPVCPTTTVTVTSTVACPVCPGGTTVTFIEQCLTLPTNWYELVPISTRTVTEKCDCADKGGTTIYVVTEPCGPISTTSPCPEPTTTECPETETEDCDCDEEEETTTCDEATPVVYAVPTTPCTTTETPCTTTTTPCTTTPTTTPCTTTAPIQSPVVFKGDAARTDASSWMLWTVIAVLLGVAL